MVHNFFRVTSSLPAVFLCLLLCLDCPAQQKLLDQYGGVEPVRQQKNTMFAGWENYYYAPGDCKCVHGGEYFVALKKSQSLTKNLMISLQGGGACWPGTIQCKPGVEESDVYTGQFAVELAERLQEDWHQAVIPYCDGSAYMGTTNRDYDGDKSTDHWHNGLRISIAALELAHKNVPDADRIFLTGCSAGGYGSIIHLRLLRYLYPDAAIHVLNESGPGLLRPETEFWQLIASSWDLGRLVPENCEACQGQLLYWYEEMLQDARVRIGLYSSYQDKVIDQSFLNVEPAKFKKLLLETSDDLARKYPDQFKRYFVDGSSHCMSNRNIEVRGTKYWDWVVALVSDKTLWLDVQE